MDSQEKTAELSKKCNELKSLLKECLPFLQDIANTSECYLKHSAPDNGNTYSHKRLKEVNLLRCKIYDAGVKNESK